MNNFAMIISAIEGGDWSDKTISAALDALREDLGHSLETAVCQVAKHILFAKDVAIFNVANRIAKPNGHLIPLVRRLLNEAVRFPPASDPAVKIVTGAEQPHLLLPRLVGSRKLEKENTIQVGAGWIIDRLHSEGITPKPSGG